MSNELIVTELAKKFQRTIEDFCCAHCGTTVTGDGFTNHCPECLWSRHVDNNPGDRENPCQGLMEPIGITGAVGKQILTHRCVKCGELKRIRLRESDNFERVLEITRGGYK